MTQYAILLLSLFTPYWFLGFYICAKMARKSFVKKCIKNPVIWHAENLPSVFLANTSGTYIYSLLFRPMGARTHTHHSRITSMTPHFPPRTIFFSRDFYATFKTIIRFTPSNTNGALFLRYYIISTFAILQRTLC